MKNRATPPRNLVGGFVVVLAEDEAAPSRRSTSACWPRSVTPGRGAPTEGLRGEGFDRLPSEPHALMEVACHPTAPRGYASTRVKPTDTGASTAR